MSVAERVRDHVRENGRGMFVDLVFAMAWVSVVTVLFDIVGGPQWARYLALFAGVIAYFGFFASLEAARETSEG